MHVCASVADSALCLSTGQGSRRRGPALQRSTALMESGWGRGSVFRAGRVFRAPRPVSCRPRSMATAVVRRMAPAAGRSLQGGQEDLAAGVLSRAVGWLAWLFVCGQGWLGMVPGAGAPELGVQLRVPKPSPGVGAEKGPGVHLVLGQSGAEDPSSRQTAWDEPVGPGAWLRQVPGPVPGTQAGAARSPSYSPVHCFLRELLWKRRSERDTG